MITDKQFEDVFRGNFASMCNFAYSIVKERDLAHDIAQQAFVNLWERRSSFDEQLNVRSYLQKSIVNLALNHFGKIKRLKFEDEYTDSQLNISSSDDSSDYLAGEVEDAVKQAVGQLPETTRTIFSLSRFQGMPNQEIADNLKISVKTVEKHITLSIKELRVKLEPYVKKVEKNPLFIVGFWLVDLFI